MLIRFGQNVLTWFAENLQYVYKLDYFSIFTYLYAKKQLLKTILFQSVAFTA